MSRRITRVRRAKYRLAVEPGALEVSCETKFVIGDHVQLVFVADDSLDKAGKGSRVQGAWFKREKVTLKMPAPLAVFRKPDDVRFAGADSPYDFGNFGLIDRADQAVID